jgi:hypothetical protein
VALLIATTGCGGLADAGGGGQPGADSGRVDDASSDVGGDVERGPDDARGENGIPHCLADAPGLSTLATQQERMTSIAVDATSVYWTPGPTSGPPTPGTIKKVSRCGGPIATAWSGEASGVFSLVVDSTSIFFWSAFATGQLNKVDKESGALTTLATSHTQESYLSATDTNLFWLALASDTMLLTVPKTGGSVSNLFSAGEPPGFLTSAGNLLAVGDHVYWISWSYSPHSGHGSILEVPIEGGVASTFASRERAVALASDGTNLFWLKGAASIATEPLAGGVRSTLATVPGHLILEDNGYPMLAMGGKYLYWIYGTRADKSRLHLARTAIVGGATTTLATLSRLTPLAADSTSVYFQNDRGDIEMFVSN